LKSERDKRQHFVIERNSQKILGWGTTVLRLNSDLYPIESIFDDFRVIIYDF
jgi:hypothetical protein